MRRKRRPKPNTNSFTKDLNKCVMTGLVPVIHVFNAYAFLSWMPGSSPGMTARGAASTKLEAP